LIAGQHFHAVLKIFGNHPLQVVAVKANQLTQEADGEKIFLVFLVFLFNNDLCQNRAGDVFAGFGVINVEFAANFDHFGQVFKRDVRARRCVVEAAIGVFFDGDTLFGCLSAHDFVPARSVEE